MERRKIMIDLIKKTLLAGVGLAAMTKDKVEELAEELTEEGELSEKEAKELLNDLLKRSKRAKKDLNKKKVQGCFSFVDLACRLSCQTWHWRGSSQNS
jgi:polyhydroxyalkanoate synthesis regulator phasin